MMQLCKKGKPPLRCRKLSFFMPADGLRREPLPTVFALYVAWRGLKRFQHTVLTNHFVKYDKNAKNTVGFYIAENDYFLDYVTVL